MNAQEARQMAEKFGQLEKRVAALEAVSLYDVGPLRNKSPEQADAEVEASIHRKYMDAADDSGKQLTGDVAEGRAIDAPPVETEASEPETPTLSDGSPILPKDQSAKATKKKG